MTEEQAVQLCVADRDPIGFEFLVRKYQREAYLHALTLLGNRDDAAEACQESFARAFASLPRLTELTAFYPWFYRILRNCCLNLLDRRRTSTNYLRAAAGPDADANPTPEALVSRNEESARVLATLASLQIEFREILALKYLRGHDYETLSSLLGIPRGTVMSRLYHARKAFQAAYRNRTGADEAIGEAWPPGEPHHG
jgi:RNA polymerase sigma-70 factor (ECF subfamily)